MSREWTDRVGALGRGAAKDVQQLLRDVEKRGGWRGKLSRGGHVQLRHSGGGSATVAVTPGSCRSSHHSRADIKRAEKAK